MARRTIPYFRFYPVEFMSGVRGLTAQDVGVYTMLLCRIYEESGPIDADPRKLATWCGMRVKTFSATLEKLVALGKFSLENGRLSNRRAMEEIQKRADDLKNSSKAGKASAQKRQQNQSEGATGVEQPFNHRDRDNNTIANAIGADARSVLFDAGLKSLVRQTGKTEDQARRLIGHWLKLARDDATKILTKINQSEADRRADPVAWIEAAVRWEDDPRKRLRGFGFG